MTHARAYIFFVVAASLIPMACSPSNQSNGNENEIEQETTTPDSKTQDQADETTTTQDDSTPSEVTATFQVGGMVFRDGKV